MEVQEKIINKMVMIQLNVSFWSGRKKLAPEDIGYNPEEFVNLGNKRLVPKKYINQFETLKKRAERQLSCYGIRLMGGYAVSEDCIDEVSEKLYQIEQEFSEKVDEFSAHFMEYVQEQADAYPEWEGRLKKAADEVSKNLRRKFAFNYVAFKLKAPAEDESSEINERFVSEEAFEEQAIREISEEADEILVSISGRETLKQTALKPVRNLKDKMKRLLTVSSGLFGKTVQLTDYVLGEMPKKGEISGRERRLLCSLLAALRNLKKHRSNFEEGAFDDLDTLIEEMGFEVGQAGTQQSGSNEPQANADNSSQEEEETVEEVVEEDDTWF
jgi:hypothetical protein